jgi:hypothetical protein
LVVGSSNLSGRAIGNFKKAGGPTLTSLFFLGMRTQAVIDHDRVDRRRGRVERVGQVEVVNWAV